MLCGMDWDIFSFKYQVAESELTVCLEDSLCTAGRILNWKNLKGNVEIVLHCLKNIHILWQDNFTFLKDIIWNLYVKIFIERYAVIYVETNTQW